MRTLSVLRGKIERVLSKCYCISIYINHPFKVTLRTIEYVVFVSYALIKLKFEVPGISYIVLVIFTF